MFPISDWFAGDLYGFVKDFLSESTSVQEGIFKRPAIMRLVDDHRDRRVDDHVRIWMPLNFEIWSCLYVMGSTPEDLSEEILDRIRHSGGGRAAA